MSKKTKEPDAVALARKAADEKLGELLAARAAAKRLEKEHEDAREAIRRAQEAADAALPQCTRVIVGWRSGKVTPLGKAVILRKTPAGLLVVRRFGDASGDEERYKWSPHSGKFMSAAKKSHFAYDTHELRDVPAEFLPEEPAHA